MDTPRRLLHLLAMFSSRPSWRAAELAERLEITERTLRRDVTRLRDLGYPITGTTGRYGGYELGAGGQLPPLLLDDEEAVAVSLALQAMSRGADSALGEAALSASAKLLQVLPKQLRNRVEAVGDVAVGVPSGRGGPARSLLNLGVLTELAVCARRGERTAFQYTDSSDRVSDRRVEPHRLVTLGRHWYLVGFDLDRDDWRTYRVDRITTLVATGHRNTPRPTPDAAAQVAEGVAVRAFELRARVRLFVPLAVGRSNVGPTVGVFDPASEQATECVVTIGGEADWIARYLIGLPMRFEVIEPDEVRAEVRSIARRLLREHAAK